MYVVVRFFFRPLFDLCIYVFLYILLFGYSVR